MEINIFYFNDVNVPSLKKYHAIASNEGIYECKPPLGGLLIWFWIEIAILQQLHWLHAMCGLPVVLGALVAIPMIPPQTVQKVALFAVLYLHYFIS